MKIFDDNWQALKDEDRSLIEPKPHSMQNAEKIKLVIWANNPNNQKFTWHESMAPYVAWIDLGDTKGLWRSEENRLYEEIQADYAVNYFGQGYRVLKSTARFEDGVPMLNVKFIHIFKNFQLLEVILILDGYRVMIGSTYKIKGGQGWKFNESVLLKSLI